MTVPYSFGTATSAIPLSQLDSNFNTPITLGNTAIQLGNTVTTLNNMTLANVTISSGNVTLTNVSVTTANVATANIATSIITSSETLSYGTANGVAYLNGSKVVTTGSALVFDGTNLGIGTSSPTTKLYVTVSAASTACAAFFNTDTANGNGLYVKAGGANSGKYALAVENAAGTSLAYLDSSGNLGIGTTSPATRLHVADTNYPYITVSNTTGTQIKNTFGANGITQIAYLGTTTNHPLGFLINDTERMRLDASGNLGLGVTPSAWASWYRSLDMLGGGSFASSDAAFLSLVGHNVYYNGSNNIYKFNGGASQYVQGSGAHQWYNAPSGTAGTAITFTQAMTLDASGNLGIGTTSPGYKLDINTTSNAFFTGIQVRNLSNGSSATSSIALGQDTNLTSASIFVNSSTNTANFAGASSFNIYQGLSAPIAFYTNASERARITSGGELLVGKTVTTFSTDGVSLSNVGSNFSYTSGTVVAVNRNGTDGNAVEFYKAGVLVGTISVTGSATAYNTSSDYRLKDNQQPLTGSGAFIDALQPKTWDWKADGSKGVGFIAHEVQEVSPNSVVGTKDAVDEEGKPIYQAMEYGSAEFIANIIAELQSLRKRLAALEAK